MEEMKKNKEVKEDELRLPSECTSILVGRQMSADGSMMIARSEDWDAMEAKNLEIHEPTSEGKTEFVAQDSPFRCELPKEALGYSALAPHGLPGHWGSAGFNTAGVGMSATESIFSSDEVLKYDPLVESGVAENSVFNIVLPYIHSAREGVERLGMLIGKHGIAEGFGISFVDSREVWYLETACGHRWLACRLPDDKYFVSGNQSRFREYNPDDKDNFLASADLIEFAREHHLGGTTDTHFDFHKAYSRDVKEDTTYNYPRVWGLQAMFTPSVKTDVTKNTFPVFATADEKITLADMKRAFRFHYNGTDHDPYLHSNPKEPYRPVSIFRTTQTHILQVRPELPQAIGRVDYMCEGMAALGVFLPYYQGITSLPEPYRIGGFEADDESAYWLFRKVMCLGMVDYNRYEPIIRETYARLEAENEQRMKEFEAQYLDICKDFPLRAQDKLQKFSDRTLMRALEVTRGLINRLFTELTRDIQKEYLFHGA